MKLLLNQNLSPRLCDRLCDIWSDVVHVRTVGLAAADDSAVWDYAREHGFTVGSKDGDFSGRSSLFGAPPKVIWLALGNCSTSEIERRLCGHRGEFETFAGAPGTTRLVIETARMSVRLSATQIQLPACPSPRRTQSRRRLGRSLRGRNQQHGRRTRPRAEAWRVLRPRLALPPAEARGAERARDPRRGPSAESADPPQSGEPQLATLPTAVTSGAATRSCQVIGGHRHA